MNHPFEGRNDGNRPIPQQRHLPSVGSNRASARSGRLHLDRQTYRLSEHDDDQHQRVFESYEEGIHRKANLIISSPRLVSSSPILQAGSPPPIADTSRLAARDSQLGARSPNAVTLKPETTEIPYSMRS